MRSEAPIVLVVDDEASVCSSIERLLRAAGYRVRTYEDIEQLALSTRPAVPCCLILDVHLRDVNGLEFKRVLERAGIRIPIIFITGFGNIPMGVRAMKGGAFDFFPKPFDVEELIESVGRALEFDARSLRQEQETGDLRRRFRSLTEREREVFFEVTEGLLNKQVAASMGITEKTVKVHRARVTEKLGAESFAGLVRMADLLRPQSHLARDEDAAARHEHSELLHTTA
jgi:FixJ family two-component response regulator